MMDQRMLQRMMAEAQKAQKKLAIKQKEFSAKVFEYTHGKNHISLTCTGNLEFKKISISPQLLDDQEMLEEILADSINHIIEQIQSEKEALESSLIPKGAF